MRNDTAAGPYAHCNLAFRRTVRTVFPLFCWLALQLPVLQLTTGVLGSCHCWPFTRDSTHLGGVTVPNGCQQAALDVFLAGTLNMSAKSTALDVFLIQKQRDADLVPRGLQPRVLLRSLLRRSVADAALPPVHRSALGRARGARAGPAAVLPLHRSLRHVAPV